MHSSAIFIASFQDGTARRHYGNRRKIHKLPRPFPDWMEERCEAARVDTAPEVVEHEIEVRARRHHLQADILGAVRITPALEGVWVDELTKWSPDARYLHKYYDNARDAFAVEITDIWQAQRPALGVLRRHAEESGNSRVRLLRYEIAVTGDWRMRLFEPVLPHGFRSAGMERSLQDALLSWGVQGSFLFYVYVLMCSVCLLSPRI